MACASLFPILINYLFYGICSSSQCSTHNFYYPLTDDLQLLGALNVLSPVVSCLIAYAVVNITHTCFYSLNIVLQLLGALRVLTRVETYLPRIFVTSPRFAERTRASKVTTIPAIWTRASFPCSSSPMCSIRSSLDPKSRRTCRNTRKCNGSSKRALSTR